MKKIISILFSIITIITLQGCVAYTYSDREPIIITDNGMIYYNYSDVYYYRYDVIHTPIHHYYSKPHKHYAKPQYDRNIKRQPSRQPSSNRRSTQQSIYRKQNSTSSRNGRYRR